MVGSGKTTGTSVWLIFLVMSGPLVNVHANTEACDDGCPLNTAPVCGIDGEWYQNRCIAVCAGVTVDPHSIACRASPMPFEDLKPGPQGAESNGLDPRTVARDVINAFRAEGLRYVGRIKLAKDLAPRPDATAPVTQPEPDTDGRGNWQVDAIRCTSTGDVYRGTMTVPMISQSLNAAEPSPLAPWFNKGGGSGLGGGGTEKLVQESGSYQPPAAAAEVQQQQQQRLQRSRPLGFFDTLRGMFSGVGSLFNRSSSSNSSNSSSNNAASAVPAADLQGDNHILEAPAVEKEMLQQQQQQQQQQQPGTTTAVFEKDSSSGGSSSSSSGDGNSQSEPSSSSDVEDFKLVEELLNSSSDSSGSSNSTDEHGDRHRRLLEIIGGDDRFSCERGYPYTAIGQIQVVDNTGLYICTGTLIKPDKVLTAAHCVWNTKRNAFYYNLNFAPGRYREGGNMVNPWGVVPWKSVTVFDSFKKNPASWDVAVVTLSKKLGSLTGYMGMAAGCSSNTALTVAGYPQDQAQGTCMANTCKVPFLDCNALTNIHTCDTIMGMSGSPLWDNKNRIRMIHVAGIADRAENRATTVTQFLVNTISKW